MPSPAVSGDRWTLAVAVTLDYLLITTSWALVDGIQSLIVGGQVPPAGRFLSNAFSSAELRLAIVFAVITTLLGYSEGIYRQSFPDRTRSQVVALVKSVGWAAILTAAFSGPSKFSPKSGAFFSASVVVSFVSLLLFRRWRERVRVTRGASAGPIRKVLIVGAGPVGREVAAYMERHPEAGRVVCGFLDDSSVPGLGVLGAPGALSSIARAEFADEIIIAAPHRSELARSAVHEAHRNHLDVQIVPDFLGCEAHDPWIETMGRIPLVTLHRERLPVVSLFLKRAVDVVISVLALLATTPLMLLIAFLIRIDSPGPLFYCAARVGRKGRRFRCYKFRTMSAGANDLREALRAHNQKQGPCFKIADDPRITRVGRWLRRYSLDELPQLWNVLRGEMSMVGPRPHPVDDFARYELEHLRRLDVTPGLTGLWQVTARESASFQTNMALDLEYIERWSLWMDLRILLKTLSVVLQGTGA